MTTAAVSDFVEVLRNSQLLEPEQLEEILRDPGPDSETLARRLVQRSWLTPYQAEQIQRGGDGQQLVLGAYRLLEPIGEGGMGQVFKALHTRLQRVVALKVIRPGHMSQDPETIRRFQREARAAALMVHPNVVMVYDADQVGDTSFIALEYVEGVDLGRLVKDNGPLSVSQACDYIRQAALGLQCAHEHSMVHRDIKPSNLLVTRRNDARRGLTNLARRPGSPARFTPLADGPAVIKILDMGLVRIIQPDDSATTQASLTREGTMMGTPDYIAPEQARNAHRVDIRADLYSLGCTLYHLLTGLPPFPEGTVIEKLLMHQLDTPRPLEDIRPDVPPGVVAIVRKLMAKCREDRYQTPAEVAVALLGVTAQLPPPPPLRPDSRPAAPVSRQPATPAPARRLVKPFVPSLTPRDSVAQTPPPQSEHSLCGQTRKVTVVMKSPQTPVPDGTTKAIASPAPTDAGSDSAVNSGPELLLVLKGHGGCVQSAAFSSDRDLLASGGVDGVVRLIDFSSSKPRERAVLAAQRPTNASRTMTAAGLSTVSTFSGHGIHSLAFSPDNRLLAAGSGAMDGLIRVWDLSHEMPQEKAILSGHRSPVDALAFAPDGKYLASGGNDRAVRLWDLTAAPARERAMLRGHTDIVKAVAFAPDGKLLASAGQDGTVRLWQTQNRLWPREQAVLPGHSGHVNTLAFSPDGRWLASGSQDQTVRLWNLTGPKPETRAVLEGHNGVVRVLLYLPGGQTLVSADDGGQVIQWDITAGSKLRSWELPRSQLCSLAITFDGRYVALGTTDGKVRISRLGPKRRKTAA